MSATIPRRIRRAVRRRDGDTCRWPSCTSRARLHVHHIVWRSRSGSHDLTNLVLLCPRHHRKVHLEGWTIEGDASGTTFVAPTGRRARNGPGLLAPVDVTAAIAELEDRGARVDEHTVATGIGEPLDLYWAVSTLLANEARHRSN